MVELLSILDKAFRRARLEMQLEYRAKCMTAGKQIRRRNMQILWKERNIFAIDSDIPNFGMSNDTP